MNPQLNIFRYVSEVQEFEAGQVIFEAGEHAEVMYVVQEGEVDLYMDGMMVETVGERGAFGEMALLDDKERAATAVAKSHVRLVPINRDQFMFMVGETPNFALNIMRIMSERLRRNNPR